VYRPSWLAARAGTRGTGWADRLRAAGTVVGARLRHGPVRDLRTGWAAAARAWRRSLQLRMVVITLVISSVLVGVFGTVVASLITGGTLDHRLGVAREKISAGAVTVSEQLQPIKEADDSRLPGVIISTLRGLAVDPDTIVVLMPISAASGIAAQSVPQVDPDVLVTRALRALVSERSGNLAHQFVTARVDGRTGPYVVYGTLVKVPVGNLELFYAFPLTTEQQQADLVRTTVVLTGFALVLALGALAALTTRLVVQPVRVAARTAQRLSAGLLDQRMTVRGEDDLALLGASFNQMAENLQRQISRLEEMSRLQRRFTSDVSHELRTPLTTVRMAADLIFSARDGFDPAVMRSAELLSAELDRFEELLTDLLEISRFDAGFAALDAEPTDLCQLVRRVTDQFAALTERAGVDLAVRLPDQPVIAEVDPRRVERILRNLVGNAVEHAEGQPVRVRLGEAAGAVAVTVRDQGVGLRAGEDKLVFNRFWRSDPSRARQTGGTGLGLSISLEDARLHGGWLEAWGGPGQGAVFRLTLPIRAGDPLVSSPLRLVPRDATGTGPARQAVLPSAITAVPAPIPAAAEPAAGPEPVAAEPAAAPEPAAGAGVPAGTPRGGRRG